MPGVLAAWVLDRRVDPEEVPLMPKPSRPPLAYGEGSVYYRKERNKNPWCWEITRRGTRVRGYEATEEEAYAALAFVRKQGPEMDPNLTVEAFCKLWLKEIVKPYRSENTHVEYERTVRLYITPHLGRKRVRDLSPVDSQSFVNYVAGQVNRRGQPFQPNTVHTKYRAFCASMSAAVRWGYLKEKITPGTELPDIEDNEINPYSEEEAIRLLRKAQEEPHGLAFMIALLMGLRLSEILGTKWEHLDLERRVYKVPGTKTKKSRRDLPIPHSLIPHLRTHRAAWLQRKLQTEDWQGGEHLFVGTQGKPLTRSYLHYSFDRFTKRNGFRPLTFHQLRHTCGTLCLLRGAQVNEVMDQLGHVKIDTVLKYLHFVKGQRAATADRMGELLASNG